MADHNLSLKEVEQLGYYDFMSYVGVPFYYTGGLKSSLELVRLCHIEENKKILMVGCGTGLSACFLAKKLGCDVVGVDIAELSVKKAQERAKQEFIADRAEFRIGNAYNLPFESDTFDAVITEFVAMFLDKTRAFKEFVRVLKPGGYVGINELSINNSAAYSNIADEILIAEQIFKEISGFELKLCTRNDWKKRLEEAGLKNVQINNYNSPVEVINLPEYRDHININELPDYNNYISIKKSHGVISNLKKSLDLKYKRRILKYIMFSKTLRNRLLKLRKAKKLLYSTGHVGCILGIAQKVNNP